MCEKNTENQLLVYDDLQPVLGTVSSVHVEQCRRLVANRYLGEGYINQNDIDPTTGIMNSEADPYHDYSEYFWSLDGQGEVSATIRLILHPTDVVARWEFPMQKQFDVEPDYRVFIEETILAEPRSVVEISALAERKDADEFAALDMYRRMWQHAVRSGYDVCLISADERLYAKISILFGAALAQVGDSKMVMGSQTVPAVLLPRECARAMADIYNDKLSHEGDSAAEGYRSLVLYLMDGLEPDYYNDLERKHLAGIGIAVD